MFPEPAFLLGGTGQRCPLRFASHLTNFSESSKNDGKNVFEGYFKRD